jgi:type IV pilus assembly protein PilC
MELRNYRYTAYTADKKLVKGRIEALNRQVCIKFLNAKNYEVIKLTEYTNILAKLDAITIGALLKPKDLVFFLKQLGALLKAGIKLLPSLELLSLQQENRQLRKIYFELYQQIYNGFSFSKALSYRPKEFPKLLIQMIEIGEISGDLAETVLRMANYYENSLKVSAQIKSAIRMPVIYLIVALGIAAGMLIFVFPNITNLFAAFGDAELPGITAFFINAGEFMAQNALYIFGGLFGFIFILVALNRFSPGFHEGLSKFLLKIPVFGELIQMNNQVLIANALSQMMGKGINSMDALVTTENVINNVVYKDLIGKTIKYIEDGRPFSKSFEESPYIDPIMSKMIATGERSGDIPKLMDNLSSYYNGVTEVRVEQIKNALQPILLLIVYVLVGVMLLALMLPMLSLGSQL